MREQGPRSMTTRRRLLRAGAGAAAVAATGLPLIGRRPRAQAAFDWKRFKGQKIEVLLAKGPRGDLLQKYEKEFTELPASRSAPSRCPSSSSARRR